MGMRDSRFTQDEVLAMRCDLYTKFLRTLNKVGLTDAQEIKTRYLPSGGDYKVTLTILDADTASHTVFRVMSSGDARGIKRRA